MPVPPNPAYLRSRRREWKRRYAEKYYKPWTTAERRLALEMRARGKTCGQIAVKIQRTPDAVHSHLRAYDRQAATQGTTTATAPLS